MQILERLVYRSRASGALASPDVDAIARQSQARNEERGITGFLLAHGDAFLQAIEGTPDAVEKLMAALERDPRHGAIVVVDRRMAPRRLFPHWAMKPLISFSDTPAIEAIRAQVSGTPDGDYLQAIASDFVSGRP